ncbi:hypothetical protein PC121_g15311 [Phytophthora cactorum]|nr:hypothetical protein PC120_g17483 [Phytophthora cactorum]KAG3056418.1 hypothetical protein PC121_g15311 [Phytophthora cactorum]
MEKPASGWFLHWSSTTRDTWGIFREHVLQHFEASNYQSVLREKLQRLKQTVDIETYNGEYSALIFRVERMSVLDQVLCYANGLKSRTRSYVKLENPETLSEAMDVAVKYEDTHFVDEVRDLQARQDKRKPLVEQGSSGEKSFKGNPSAAKDDLSRDLIPSELKTVPVSTARSLVTSRPTSFSGRRNKGTRETGNHVSKRGSRRG